MRHGCARRGLLEVRIRAWREMEVGRCEPCHRRVLQHLDAAGPRGFQLAIGLDVLQRDRIVARPGVQEGASAQVNNLDARRIGAVGPDIRQRFHGHGIRLRVVADRILPRQFHPGLRPALGEHHVGVGVCFHLDLLVALECGWHDQTDCFTGTHRQAGRGGIGIRNQNEYVVGSLAGHVSVERDRGGRDAENAWRGLLQGRTGSKRGCECGDKDGFLEHG